MNKKKKPSIPRFTQKNPGVVLLVSMVLSGLILTVGLGLAKILATEVHFSADILFSEKAYFAAESGVEVALIELKKNPVQNIKDHQISLDDATSNIAIGNLLDEFSFSLEQFQTQKLRLQKDSNSGKTFAEGGPVDSFDLEVDGGRFHWKFLCQTSDEKTVALQNVFGSGKYQDFYSQMGKYDNKNGITISGKTFNDIKISIKNCFFSITNLGPSTMTVTFSGTELPPPRATVRATGISGNRKKTIAFEYAQKNLSSFFDFGLFHTDDGFQ
jgi:hypothetical protein